MQVPPVQADVAFGRLQGLTQAPQWARLVLVSTSQPLATSPSQSWYAPPHVAASHWPFVHAGAAFGTTQTLPQAPQLPGSDWVSTSQPSAASPLQSS